MAEGNKNNPFTNYSTDFTFSNGWQANGFPTAIKNDKTVFLTIGIRNGDKTDGTLMCTIPSGYRPTTRMSFPIFNLTTRENVGYAEITTNGNVSIYNALSTATVNSCYIQAIYHT